MRRRQWRRMARWRALTTAGSPIAALGSTGSLAVPLVRHDPVLDFQGKRDAVHPGLLCARVPTRDSGLMPLVMLVTSDSSERVATVEYSLPTAVGTPYLHAAGYPVGNGRVMVLRGTQVGPVVWGTAVREGPSDGLRDTCEDHGVKGSGEAEVVHLVPVQRPSATDVRGWCELQPWCGPHSDACPALPYA